MGGMETEERYLRDAILGCSYYEVSAGSRWKEKRQGSSTHPGGGYFAVLRRVDGAKSPEGRGIQQAECLLGSCAEASGADGSGLTQISRGQSTGICSRLG